MEHHCWEKVVGCELSELSHKYQGDIDGVCVGECRGEEESRFSSQPRHQLDQCGEVVEKKHQQHHFGEVDDESSC